MCEIELNYRLKSISNICNLTKTTLFKRHSFSFKVTLYIIQHVIIFLIQLVLLHHNEVYTYIIKEKEKKKHDDEIYSLWL